ncbi:MAG: Ig-like domain-containing protein, partial [Bacteroidota bacterium]
MGKRFNLLVVFAFFVSIIHGQTITRGPYIQMLSDDRAVVRYRTSTPVPTEVSAGTSLGVYTEFYSSATNTTEHEAIFTGLNADTRYFYAINQNASPLLTPSSDRYFQTAPPTGSHSLIRAWILGDCGTGNANARSVRNAYYNYLGNQHNDLILMLGDNAYNNGTDAEYQGAVFQNMYEDLLAQSPLFPTLGNHEFYNGATSSATGIGPYFNIFSLPTNAELGGLASGTEAYYSYDYGNIHFISLDSHDSDRSPSGPMLTWLDNDLALTQQEWIVVYFHHPPYSKGSHDSDDVSDSGGRLEDMRENVLPILENYGVDLVLSGHSHSYERSYLLDGHYGLSSTLTSAMILDNGDGQENGDGAYQKNYLNAASSAGAIYITSGSAGKISGGPLNHPVMHASFNTLGSCILEVDGGRLDLKFLNNSGVIADSFTINKQIFVGSPPTVSISNPLDGAFIPLPTTITLSSISNDADGNVQSVEYFVNGISAGSSTVSPFDLSYVIPASGTFDLYAIATDNDGNAVTSNVISFNVGASTASLTVAVSNSNDDAEEGVSGTIKLTSSDLELINEANSADQLVGIRFRNISVPAGAKIDSAYIQFTVDELNNANPVDISIRGEQHFNSATFANVLGNLSNRDFTEASVVWSPINWTIVGQSAADQRTPNLASIMQEIVDLPGWQANNAASFFLSGWGRRIAESYDGTAAPELSVYYTISPPPLNTAPEISISGIPEGATQINFDPITFVAKTKDSTDYVNRVEFYLNGVLQVNDNTFPFSHDITPTSNGAFQLVAVAIDQGGLSTADTLNYTIDNTIVPTTRTGTIATSIADAEENKSGLVLLNGNRLDLVRNASYTTGNQVIGLHYSNLDIPQGSIIYEAYLQFVSAAGNQNYHIIDLEISGHASENAPIFSNVNSNLSSRARTSATVSWAPPVWTATNQVLPAQRTPDISSILQEIVDRPGWQSNNGLALLIEGEGGRAAHAYDSNPARAPQLFISYLAPPQPVQVERGPYLQMGSDTSMVVRLRTQTPRQLELIYGTNLNNLNQSVGSGSSTTEHEFFIGGLNPNTTYYYAFAEGVDTFLTPNNNLYWRTAPSPGTQQAIKAWILGDPGTANANARAVRDAYYSRMNGQHTDLMIMLGDNAYNNGTDAQYQAAVFENMYEALLQKTVLYPAPGNHEFYNGGTSSATETGPYYDIFSLPKNAEAGGLASGTEAYYSYDFGNVHFISLDSHDSDRSTSGSMLTWLTNDLAATDQEWIVVYFHHPPYTKGSHDSDNVNDSGGRLRDIRENVLPILENYGVDLVLSGHSHSYERSFLLNGHYDISSTLTPAMILDNGNGQVLGDGAYEKDYLNNASTEGTVYITAGSSGKISGGALNHPAMYASLNTLGSCLLEVDGDQLELKFLTSTGIVADSFLIQKTIIIGDPPVVNMTAPLNASSFAGPQTITLEANATDSDGTVSSVEFVVNNTAVGTVNAAPWQLNFAANIVGNYEVYAIATDNDGNVVNSDTIQFSITPSLIPPTVSISAPVDGTIYPAPQAITLAANAADADGTVTSVEFFINGLSIGTVNAAPWQLAYVIPASGTYDLYAIAADDDANTTTSATIQFSAKTPPTVSISAPLDGTIYPAPQAITLAANAADADGSITGVEFFVNGLSIGTVNAAPWQLAYVIPASGTYDLYAIAADDDANTTTSATIQFSAKTPPTVSISTPVDGTIYPAPQAITLAANAADADGSITGVEFFVNGISVGTVNTAPWQLAYVIPASGTYDVYAVATDDDGNNTTSATIQFSAKTPPTVSISAPLDGTIYPAPQAITLEANAADPDGSITGVEFFVNG